ncbi:MAG: ribonuclease Z [Promethearchaeota archaeon]
MDLIFLGTSGATPTKTRNLPAVALRLDSGHILLFDAGEDVQRRFEAANLKFNVPTTIFISHLHGDHIIGLPGLLFNFHLNSRTKPLTIIGPFGIASFLLMHYQIVGLKAEKYPLTVIEVIPPYIINGENSDSFSDVLNVNTRLIKYSQFLTPNYERTVYNRSDNIVFSTKKYQVKYAWVEHSVPTMGFRFEEMPLDGKFNPNRAIEMGVPRGSLWKQMQKGKKVKLNSGIEIDPLESGIVSPPRPGRIICYSADSKRCVVLINLAKKADVFICEATYGKEFADLAEEKKHLTAATAAEIAKEAEVCMLFLTHFSSRYKDVTSLLEEAQEIFPNTNAAEDLLSFKIQKRGSNDSTEKKNTPKKKAEA